MNDSKIVEIYSAANSFDAYAMVNALEEAGIKASVASDLSLGINPQQYPSVYVGKEDEARARELLKQLKAEAAITPETDDEEKDEGEE